MNSFSLLTTPWLPVRFKDGTTGKLAPVDLADENVVDISAPRADLQGAVWQFLLGLLQTSFAPKDHRRWDDIWEDGLEAEKLREALQSLEHAFQFGPDSPSFMQDFEALTGDKVPVASLLPEIPGAQTTKFNKDHFIKRGVTEYLCPHCSALALFSLQLNAPSGGKGYRTGLRGGGPMTTLIELQEYQGNQQTPLWRKLWINVMPQDEADLPLPKKFDDLVFPWLGPTRTSELAGAVVTDEQVNKLQAYWGMPRRIRIDFNTTTVGNCDICGEQSDALLSLMTTKNYGANYAMWQHPLTPYRVPLKEGGEFYSVKPQPGGLIWRDWLGLIETGKSENNTELPALVVKLFNASSLKQAKVGLWGFGYDFDNMKARCWYEHHFPLLLDKKEGQIRGIEGSRVRQTYALLAKQYGVKWNGRKYDPKDWEKGDVVNRCISAATSCLYGISEAAVLAAGYAPAIGFIHSGKPLSFVYDIADIIKFDLVVPKAFEIAARQPAEPDKEVRLACRDIFRSSKLTGKLIPLIEEVLAAGEIEPPQPAPDMLPPAIPEPETLGDSGHRGRGG